MRYLYPVLILSVILQLFSVPPLYADKKFTLLLTSNLRGRFSMDIDNQDDNDPMLLLAQSIIREKDRSRFDIYLDLGNAFYPGVISKYSYGSVMMDFFSYFNCAATLISSRDISIGLSNLEFLAGGKKTKLLSANIIRNNLPVFTPYIVINHGGKKIGIIGVTSSDGLFDIADKKVLKISFSEYRESIKAKAESLKKEGCDNLILLSGLSYRNNLELMQQIPDVYLIISGGDSSGKLFSVPASRVDVEWGRSIVTLTDSDGFYRLDLDLGTGITVQSMEFNKSSRYKTQDKLYAEFANRLSIWKGKFRKEENRPVAENLPPVNVTDTAVANLLRHRYRCEIGIIEKNSILSNTLSGSVYHSSIMSLLNNDYPVFTYSLTGAQLNKIAAETADLVITGLDNGKVQNYPVAEKRTYTICSTQYAYDTIARVLQKDVVYNNTWNTLQNEIESDLKSEKRLTSKNFDYLEERFRILADISLSNFYDRSIVSRGSSIETPPGRPEETYRRWGMEDTFNITLYNAYHQLTFTPYLYFIKQNEEYQQNLLRGTLLYTYNPNNYFRPYHKTQADTVLVDVNGRPVLVRETAGFSLITEKITGRIGAGFEKQVQDPEKTLLYGIETLIDINYPLTAELVYVFKLDSFFSLEERRTDRVDARAEISNALTYKINTLLGISLKYKWFYYHSREIQESYKYSQTLISLDLNANFKFL